MNNLQKIVDEMEDLLARSQGDYMNTETPARPAYTNPSIFATKAEYLTFLQNWKQLFANRKHVPEKVEYIGWANDANGKWSSNQVVGYRYISKVNAMANLIYQAARGRDLNVVFANAKSAKLGTKYYYYKQGLKDARALFDLTDEQFAMVTTKVEAFFKKLYTNVR